MAFNIIIFRKIEKIFIHDDNPEIEAIIESKQTA